MPRFKSEYIYRIRKLIAEKDAKPFGQTYDAMFHGEKLEHLTMSYKIPDPANPRRTKYVYQKVPVEAYEKAEKQAKDHKYTPAKVVTTDAKYGNKGSIKMSIYRGNFTRQEIVDKAQEFSNKLRQRGKRGKLSVAVNVYGQYRRSILTDFGDPVKVYDPSESDWVAEMPEDGYAGYSLNVIYQN